MPESQAFTLELEQIEGYEFRVKFDWPGNAELLLDEPEPLGHARGPNAARLIAAAVGNCLAASLVFCMAGKFKQKPGPVRANVTGHIERNEHGRLRIGGFEVTLKLSDTAASIGHFDRCLEQFEDFCIATQSIRQG
ncbi:MAG: OsmC family peroxiredoxin, partial [Betaproteobacteria bacterium]